MYTPETSCIKRPSVHINNMSIKQLCNHKVRDFATAFWVRKLFGTFEKRARGRFGVSQDAKRPKVLRGSCIRRQTFSVDTKIIELSNVFSYSIYLFPTWRHFIEHQFGILYWRVYVQVQDTLGVFDLSGRHCSELV